MKFYSRPSVQQILIFLILGLVWRILFLPFSQGSYTDGLLQLTVFERGLTYWPPMTAVLARLFSWIPGLGLEAAGRLVASFCGAAMIIPIHAIGLRLFGKRAAFWAMAAWTASPMALRWSLQPMSDMPMALFVTGSLACLLLTFESARPDLFPGEQPEGAGKAKQHLKWLWLASIFALMGVLTRYQAILWVIPLFGGIIYFHRCAQIARFKIWMTLVPWIVLPLWLLKGGLDPILEHFDQFGERAGSGFLSTLIQIYWYFLEEFVMRIPYFLTWGLTGFGLYGIFRTHWGTPRLRWSGYVTLYLVAVLLILQSVFAAFQERYLLPLLPLACLFVGHGIAIWWRHMETHPRWFWGLTIPAFGYAILISMLVGVYQSNPFLDLKQASLYVRNQLNPTPDQRILTNASFNPQLGPVKVRYWTGREDVEALVVNRETQPVRIEGSLDTSPLRGDDIIVLSSLYLDPSMGLSFHQFAGWLADSLPAEVLIQFDRRAYPIFPDLLQEAPGWTHTPMVTQRRYHAQRFQTLVLQVRGDPEAGLLEAPRPVLPERGARMENLIEELEQTQEAIEQLQ